MSEIDEKMGSSGEVEDTDSPKPRAKRATARRGRPKRSSTSRGTTEKIQDNIIGSLSEDQINGDSVSENNSQENGNNESSEPTNTEASDVPELDDAPPPTITTTPTNTSRTLKLRTSFSQGDSDDIEEKKNDKMEDDIQIPDEFTVVEEVASDSDDVQEVHPEKMDVEPSDVCKISPHTQTLEDMTVIDEVIDDTEKKDGGDDKQDSNLEPDTEMVSEDELPAEVNKEPLETEAVSDEELPTTGDLPDTEAVSEDELPPEGSEKKKKKRKSTPNKGNKDADSKQDTTDGSATKKESSKRKLGEGDYDPSSPTSEASDDSPATKKAATDGKSVSKPATKTNKVLPELEKYWKAVREDATDFTGWTYLLQYVDQENDVEAAREAYDAFLSHYPYCYGYWRKYADYEKRKGNKSKCEELTRTIGS